MERIPKPRWLKQPLPTNPAFRELEQQLSSKKLYTVCQEAKCPNIGECWSARTATMMILGDTCTRACRFCNVKTGNPKGFINLREIDEASAMVETMGLRYLVITSVDRDDLPDFGAGHFSAVVKRIHRDHPNTRVEVLIPDFNNDEQAMHTLAESRPFVIAQNLETVNRLTHPVRDRRAGYQKTLDALKFYKTHYPEIATKSSLMVGLGETKEELEQATRDLINHGVEVITFGQYLRPSARHLKVERYYHPDEFISLKEMAYQAGALFVAAGPMVRSSYKASEFLDFLEKRAVQQGPNFEIQL